MKKITILFLLLPLLAIAQTNTAGWLTPYADARFENGKLIYTVTNPQQSMNFRLLPLMYPRNLVQLRFDSKPIAVNGRYIGESQIKIRDYLNTEPVSLRSTKEQKEYLRLSAMVLIWDLELDRRVLTELDVLKNSEKTEIKNHVELILQLEAVYKGLR